MKCFVFIAAISCLDFLAGYGYSRAGMISFLRDAAGTTVEEAAEQSGFSWERRKRSAHDYSRSEIR